MRSQIIETNKKISELKKIALRDKKDNIKTEPLLSKTGDTVSISSLLALNAKAVGEIIMLTEVSKDWEKASQKMLGNWEYFVIEKETVNAFVTDLCPRKIFIFKGLLNLISNNKNRSFNDDELALIIGHEISHLILSHNDSQRQLALMLTSFQLLVLTFLDPVGFFSFFVDLLNYQIVQYISASYSRQHEEEADALGMLAEEMI